MSARTNLIRDLDRALSGFNVRGSNAASEPVSGPTVLVWQDGLRRDDQFGLNSVVVELKVWVLSAFDSPERADEDLDNALEEVLGALQEITWVSWTEAKRAVLADANAPGYMLTVTAVARVGV